MVMIPNCEFVAQSDRLLSLKLPAFSVPSVALLVSKCRERHGGFIAVRLESPRKPRTTGPGSQSAHLHGHLQQLAEYTGYTMGEIKEAMKEDLLDWPSHEVVLGGRRHRIYSSEADADTVLESKAVEWTHVRAAEMGITLVEE
jgi:hypothetical protein